MTIVVFVEETDSSCAGCDGVANSGVVNDDCGVCGGDGSSCAGCDGVANSGVVNDDCGVCGGDGSSCADVPGCTDANACNYDSTATLDNGSCDFCSCGGGDGGTSSAYTMTVESSAAVNVPGATIYRFYANLQDASDKFSAVFGNDQDNLVINTPDGILMLHSTQVGVLLVLIPHFLDFSPIWRKIHMLL